ncbi:DUF1445 domain-containing protein [Verminephrobacter sp. Larva24]|nr:DUF1445 domain-containing protein [Verminephrobacter sp. Larva24]
MGTGTGTNAPAHQSHAPATGGGPEGRRAFVLGCSFSFEHGLIEAGIPLRHVDEGKNVAMYRTNIQTVPAGPFHGPMVVSMRPMKAADAIRAVQITARVPQVHGAPVHIGDPALIGIADITQPDFGDAVRISPARRPRNRRATAPSGRPPHPPARHRGRRGRRARRCGCRCRAPAWAAPGRRPGRPPAAGTASGCSGKSA